MRTGGWIFLSISLGLVCSVTGWCFYKVLTHPKEP